jgi:hypothetical protein
MPNSAYAKNNEDGHLCSILCNNGAAISIVIG